MQLPLDILKQLNAKREWFEDTSRSDNVGPFVMVQDNFYTDPIKIRKLALRQSFFQYSPPLSEQVSDGVASGHPDKRPAWLSSSLLRYWGKTVKYPKPGFRYAPTEVRDKIASLLNENISETTWHDVGDWWNGAFHIQFETWHYNRAAIHHHYKDGDISPRGWGGVVYLSPDASADAGTSVWKEKSSGLCVAKKGAKFDSDQNNFELVFKVENRFNRLVLFRENVLHRVEHGFGTSVDNARLVQTFFFHSVKRQSTCDYQPIVEGRLI